MQTSYLEHLVHGVGLGASIAVQLGPMKILCLRRVLAFGAAAGIVTAAGVVSGDAIFVAIAALGMTAATAALHSAGAVLRIIGGGALLYLAIDALRRRLPTGEAKLERSRLMPMYAGTVGLTLTNPITIVMFATVLLSSGGIDAFNRAGGATPLGMVLGSALVWTAFTIVTIVAGRSLKSSQLIWLNRVAAALLFYFGATAIWAGLSALL